VYIFLLQFMKEIKEKGDMREGIKEKDGKGF
jgi:hypothetical protein